MLQIYPELFKLGFLAEVQQQRPKKKSWVPALMGGLGLGAAGLAYHLSQQPAYTSTPSHTVPPTSQDALKIHAATNPPASSTPSPAPSRDMLADTAVMNRQLHVATHQLQEDSRDNVLNQLNPPPPNLSPTSQALTATGQGLNTAGFYGSLGSALTSAASKVPGGRWLAPAVNHPVAGELAKKLPWLNTIAAPLAINEAYQERGPLNGTAAALAYLPSIAKAVPRLITGGATVGATVPLVAYYGGQAILDKAQDAYSSNVANQAADHDLGDFHMRYLQAMHNNLLKDPNTREAAMLQARSYLAPGTQTRTLMDDPSYIASKPFNHTMLKRLLANIGAQ